MTVATQNVTDIAMRTVSDDNITLDNPLSDSMSAIMTVHVPTDTRTPNKLFHSSLLVYR